MNQKDALKLLEMSSNLATQAMQARTANGGQLTEIEVKELFATCFDTVYEKFQTLPIAENAEEKFATIAEMHQIFAEKFAELEKREDKFATISEMHKIFSIKFAEIDRQQEKFSSIAEMHQIFTEKLVQLERRDEKFATIAEMHRLFAEKFAEIDQKLATLSQASRPMRRPV